jgi:hypothetical protein
VQNISYPAHSLDRLWSIRAWNQAAAELFELGAQGFPTRVPPSEIAQPTTTAPLPHLLALIFDPAYRARFRPWESLARRLVSDFKYQVRASTHLPDYRTLWRALGACPILSALPTHRNRAACPRPALFLNCAIRGWAG